MNLPASTAQPAASSGRWYQGVTRSQWLVLSIACAVWICDAYDSQIFNVTRSYILADVMHLAEGDPSIRLWGDIFLGVSLIGGAIGGTLFGSLSDRIGRRPAMIGTILMFTIFSGLTAFAQSGWQVATLRFFLAMAQREPGSSGPRIYRMYSRLRPGRRPAPSFTRPAISGPAWPR